MTPYLPTVFISFLSSAWLRLDVLAVPLPTPSWGDHPLVQADAESPQSCGGFISLLQKTQPALSQSKRIVGVDVLPEAHLKPGRASSTRIKKGKGVHQETPNILGTASPGKVVMLILLPISLTLLLLYFLIQDVTKTKRGLDAKVKARKRRMLLHETQVGQCSIDGDKSQHDSATPSTDRTSSDVLDPAHVVRHPDGLTLAVGGLITPGRQDQVLDVVKVGHKNEVTMRILLSETGEENGTLLESADNVPIGFLSTGLAQPELSTGPAISREGQEPPSASREVTICRTSPECPPHAVVVPDAANDRQFKVHRGSRDGPIIHTVQLSAPDMKVVNADGVLMALVDAHISKDGCQRLSLQINPDVDASLVLCMVLASIKLM